LEQSGIRPEAIFGEVEGLDEVELQVESYASAAEAGEAAGIRVRTPAWIPQGFSSTSIMVSSEAEGSLSLKTAGLQAVVDALGLTDVEIPEGLDGQTITVHIPRVVTQAYMNATQGEANEARTLAIVQARSPDVAFPAGVDLSQLAYAALRVLGMSRDEAYRMSVTIDWRSTLIVPVPAQAVAYRPINVSGSEGLLIEGLAQDETHPGGVLMWSEGGVTYAVAGAVSGEELLTIAQNLQ
jgi:hypothetical protein